MPYRVFKYINSIDDLLYMIPYWTYEVYGLIWTMEIVDLNLDRLYAYRDKNTNRPQNTIGTKLHHPVIKHSTELINRLGNAFYKNDIGFFFQVLQVCRT